MHLKKRIFSFLLSVSTIVGLLLTANVPSVFAMQTKPPTDWSFYIRSMDINKAYTLGCNQGTFDASHGNINSEVVLAFGEQTSTGTYEAGTSNVFFSNYNIENLAVIFTQGYFNCLGNDKTSILTLGIGTNNYAYSSYANGQVWANVVKIVQDFNHSHGWDTRVKTIGANDMETSWGGTNSAQNTKAWADGFASVAISDPRYLDFGDAGGCTAADSSNNFSCNNGWHQSDVWYVSWGALPAYPLPEIYYNPPPYSPVNAQQWTMISLYSNQHKGGRIDIKGPLDENSAQSSNNSDQAWSQLWTTLNSHSETAQSLTYSAQMHWQ